jgi:signal recognition particle receptor subunit beta
VKYNPTRKMVLGGADAVVFVADSEKKRHEENVESLKNLAENLIANGLHIHTIPLVFQYNKRDRGEIASIEFMDKKLNFKNLPSFGSVAIDPNDSGVLESFIAALVSMMKSFGEKYQLGTKEEIMGMANYLEKNIRGFTGTSIISPSKTRKIV